MADAKSGSSLHVVMYPWYAMGHLTTFLHVSNKLAERGHRVSFLIPTKTIQKLNSFNHHPDLITFVPITLPRVPGLPRDAETTADVPFPLHPLIMTAMDLTKPVITDFLRILKPDLVIYDFTHWLPGLVQSLNLNIKCVYYCIVSAAAADELIVSLEKKILEKNLTVECLTDPPTDIGPSVKKLPTYRAKALVDMAVKEYGSGVPLLERLLISLKQSHAIAFKSCREMEGLYLDYVQRHFKKPVLTAGPVIPGPPTVALDEKWEDWLNQFNPKSVIFCALGSECILQEDQFHELVLGLEKTGLPFLAALKPPTGHDTVESALPQGFENRVKERGVVHGGWVQQQLILNHPSVGCFVTHCGFGSMSEGLVSECQLVLIPYYADQHTNASVMGDELKVGVAVKKRNEDGFFDRDGVFEAVMAVMDEGSEIGKEVRKNHTKWRQVLLQEGLERSYIDSFIEDLRSLLKWCWKGLKSKWQY